MLEENKFNFNKRWALKSDRGQVLLKNFGSDCVRW